jgi:hypothetical protein
MLPTIISKIGLPVLINVLSETLTKMDSPAAKSAGEGLKNVAGAIQSGGISHEQIIEANRHAEAMAEVEMERLKIEIAEVNATYRAEVSSSDAYVRRMRPTFGYMMAITWAAQMLGLAYIIVFDTGNAGFVLNAMGNLTVIWGAGLSVLGIYVYKRSEEKKAQGPEQIFWARGK